VESRPESGGERETTEAGGGGAACLGRLQGRQDDVCRALGGRSLRVLLDYTDADADRAVLRVLFTRSGYVVPMVRDDEPFNPHVEVRGTRHDVHAFLAGDTDLLDAVLAKLVVLRIPEDEVAHYRPLRALVAEELRGQ
jgi:hypothetical protein